MRTSMGAGGPKTHLHNLRGTFIATISRIATRYLDRTTLALGAELEGTWNQSGVGYARGVRVTWENQTVVIEAADGQTFTGCKEYTRDGEQPQKEVGIFQGRLVDGKIQGQYAEIGDDAAAINIELSRK